MVETQRKGRAAPEREVTDEIVREDDLLLQLEQEEDDAPTPEEIAAEHKRQVEEANARASQEAEARAKAEAARSELETKYATVQTDAYAAQEKAIDAQIEAQNQLLAQATQSYRAARDVGDIDAEMKALDAMTDAKTAKSALAAQKTYVTNLKSQAPKVEQQQQQTRQQDTYRGAHGYSKASEDWIAKNPRFDSDPDFKSAVLGAASAAQMDGIMPDTPAFFRYIEERAAKLAPDPAIQRQQQQSQTIVRRTPPASSMAAPPSRDSGTITTREGKVRPSDIAKALGVSVDDLQTYANIARMPLDKYCLEQASIIDEQRRGQNTGLYRGESN